MLQYRAHGCVELCELLNVFWSGVMEIPSCNWLASDFFFWVSQWKLISINRYFNLFHTLWSFMFLIHDVHTPMSRSLKIFGRFDHATMLAVICKYDKYLHIFCLHKLCCWSACDFTVCSPSSNFLLLWHTIHTWAIVIKKN